MPSLGKDEDLSSLLLHSWHPTHSRCLIKSGIVVTVGGWRNYGPTQNLSRGACTLRPSGSTATIAGVYG